MLPRDVRPLHFFFFFFGLVLSRACRKFHSRYRNVWACGGDAYLREKLMECISMTPQ